MVKTSTCVEGHVFTHNVGWVPEHLKHLLKTVDRYWIPVSDRGQTTRVWQDFIAPYIPAYVGTNDISFFLSSLILVVLDGGWPCMNKAHRYGGRPLGLPPRRSYFLGLRVCFAEQWPSAEALSNQLPQVIYHKYVSLRGTSFLKTGVVLCP